ncbi:MAG TPA: sigma-54 dependent transcriptional regulator [Pyrinomonadaceae bacterium]|nr:sigma-54 dependent transcriptional regulator [Pyrinomonadaceae bacterium]
MKTKILFVEDDERLKVVLLEAATISGYHAEGVGTAEEAIGRLRQESFDIVVTDMTLPGMSGLDLLRHLPGLCPGIIAVVMTAYGTVEVAVEAMKRGATDFITKPFELDTLLSTISVATERVARRALLSGRGMADVAVVAESAPMQKVFEQVAAIAPFNTTVLVTGETGTGKEIVARAIHQQSPRKGRALIPLNCAAIPEHLLEDELFGHVKGAFTGAQTGREGRFEQANGGTLFLDEIGDMSLPLQAKLLRVLQEREFEKLGSSRSVKVDVRIVAATSADIERRVEDGSFRADLFYRLNVVHLHLPPLRERRDDIPLLAESLLARFCQGAGLPHKSISDEARSVLLSYRWPGNVRQLQNAMERAAAITGAATTIQLNNLPEEVRGGAASGVTPALAGDSAPAPPPAIPDQGLSFDAVVTKVERELLLQSLDKAGGNKMRAAKLLNMKRTTFVEKLKRLQIDTKDED